MWNSINWFYNKLNTIAELSEGSVLDNSTRVLKLEEKNMCYILKLAQDHKIIQNKPIM